MNNTEFKTQYQEEVNELKAPADLIARTKLAVAAEEKEIKAKKKRVKYLYSSLATVAATLALFIGVAGFMHMQAEQGDTLFAEGDSLQGTTLYLGENKNEIYLEEQIEIDRTAILPMAFLKDGAWEEEIHEKTVKFTTDEEGNYIAAFEEEDAYVVVYSKLRDAEDMKECVEKMITGTDK